MLFTNFKKPSFHNDPNVVSTLMSGMEWEWNAYAYQQGHAGRSHDHEYTLYWNPEWPIQKFNVIGYILYMWKLPHNDYYNIVVYTRS